ncbi:unnamed protein product [Linum tenue]|uniref:AP complex mu/sigma subunit domain-containing protein n=1 Tax=Linum tenue TaxID=586396 RepID=A0AAV0H6W6_9ROSI|nr:unnamed protein product [Linum tenue]
MHGDVVIVGLKTRPISIWTSGRGYHRSFWWNSLPYVRLYTSFDFGRWSARYIQITIDVKMVLQQLVSGATLDATELEPRPGGQLLCLSPQFSSDSIALSLSLYRVLVAEKGKERMGIRFILMVNKKGQTRLAQYYEWLTLEERRALEGEIVRKCLARNEQQVSLYLYPLSPDHDFPRNLRS